MKLNCVILSVGFGLICNLAQAQLDVTTESRVVAAETSYFVPVIVDGGVELNAMSLAYGLNDGGATQGGEETATVVGSTLDQTMWDRNAAVGSIETPALVDVFFTPALPVEATVADMFGTSSVSSETANGRPVLFLELDLSSKSVGDLVVLNPDFAQFTVAVGLGGIEIPLGTVTSGTLTITRRGDANGDGVVNNLDISAFILRLNNASAYSLQFPNVDSNSVLDFSGDNNVNNLDIAGFINALQGG